MIVVRFNLDLNLETDSRHSKVWEGFRSNNLSTVVACFMLRVGNIINFVR